MTDWQQAVAIPGAVLAAGALVALLLVPARAARWAPALAWTCWLALLAGIAPGALAARPLVLVGGLGLGTAALVVAGPALLARPRLLAAALATTLPVRVPVPLGGETFNLLLPLYAVVSMAFVGLAVEAWRGGARLPRMHRDAPRATRWLDLAVGGMALLASASLAWAFDRAAGTVDVALFFVPFLMLYVVVRCCIDQVTARTGAAAFVGVMSVAAIVGIYQAATRTLWQNPRVMVANEYAPDFRTNSIFWDPNIYGRYLVAALLVLVTAALLWQVSVRSWRVAAAVVAGALMVVGLWNTFSQSSFIAMAFALATLALLWMRRWERITLFALIGLVALAPQVRDRAASVDDQGRGPVAAGGVRLFRAQPLTGVGVGSFEKSFVRARPRGAPVPALRSSHTTPITVMAELGVGGLALYLLSIAAALALLRRGRGGPAVWAAATLAAVCAHSLFYAGFYEDPIVWVAFAVLATRPAGEAQAARA